MKNLTKLGFGHVKTFLRSFWAISIDMQNPYGNELWVEKYVFLTKMIDSAEYSTSVEISAWKYFFRKVWIMSYIFHISHVWKYSKPTELHYFKVTLQNTFFKGFYFKKPTARVYGYDSRANFLKLDFSIFIVWPPTFFWGVFKYIQNFCHERFLIFYLKIFKIDFFEAS